MVPSRSIGEVDDKLCFYEFFAGGGMARLGLGPNWRCLFANDWNESKQATYVQNFGESEPFFFGDVRELRPEELPGQPNMVWGSFPCQDLSLAGPGAGLSGTRSGVFWPFWSLLRGLASLDRKPPVVVLENVVGALSSHQGKDFAALTEALVQGGYRVGALVMNAVDFLPQSRPRLFVVGVGEGTSVPSGLEADFPDLHWHPEVLRRAVIGLSGKALNNWIWWRLPKPEGPVLRVESLLESEGDVEWHSSDQTLRLIDLMAPIHRAKLEEAQKTGKLRIGFAYRRTRIVESVRKQQIEIRFDGIAGCLRTPAGGSSRQILFLVDGQRVRSRLLSAREAARLMGIPDSYKLPVNYNDAYELAGDGVAVPVVAWLERNLLRPIALSARGTSVEVSLRASNG